MADATRGGIDLRTLVVGGLSIATSAALVGR
jgi:hypothetical protein